MSVPTRSSSLRSLAMVAATGLVLVACGGGDDATSVLSGGDDTVAPVESDVPVTDGVTTTAVPVTTVPATDPVAPDPPPSDPPATEPPATEPPATESPATDAPPSSDSPPVGPDAAYCGASSQFYVEARALREIDENDNDAARQLFEQMQLSLAATLINAPDEAAAATPRRMEAVFAVILPAFDTLGFDLENLDTLPNADEVATNFEAFVEIIEQLETFLVEGCGADVEALRLQAVDLAAVVASDGTPANSIPSGGDPLEVQTIVDDSGEISADVPVAWSEVRGAPDGELRQLIAAPDVDAFLAAYSEPGVALLSGDAPAGNGAEAAQGAIAGFQASVEADGCVQDEALPYDDGLYTGDQLTYSCVGTNSVTRLAAGTNPAGDVFWLLAAVALEGDDSSWAIITESFLVD